MRIAQYILEHTEDILADWEAFASTLLPAASDMTPLALRDHAEEILSAVARDLQSTQTAAERSGKREWSAPKMDGVQETAAQTHAVLRAKAGFDITQLVAEYRALRASVLRLWIDHGRPAAPEIGDVIRFNEAIDQAVAESVGHFHLQMEKARNLFLGMLGHDMRSPLNSILMTAASLAAMNAGEDVSSAAHRLMRSGASMKALLDDLVDFNRSTLGVGFKIDRSDTQLEDAVADELGQLRGAHPDRQIELTATGDTRGQWDAGRMQQLLRNLVSNALRYAADDTPVRVTIRGNEVAVDLEVTNVGPPIDRAALDEIFDPLRRVPMEAVRGDDGDGFGLGLFIVREIARAHDGEVNVRSEAGQTTFGVTLPRASQDQVGGDVGTADILRTD